MNDAISQTDDLMPGNIRMSLPDVLAHTGSAFADDFQNLEDRILVQIAPYELRIGEICRKGYGARRYQHVQQYAVTPHRWFPQ